MPEQGRLLLNCSTKTNLTRSTISQPSPASARHSESFGFCPDIALLMIYITKDSLCICLSICNVVNIQKSNNKDLSLSVWVNLPYCSSWCPRSTLNTMCKHMEFNLSSSSLWLLYWGWPLATIPCFLWLLSALPPAPPNKIHPKMLLESFALVSTSTLSSSWKRIQARKLIKVIAKFIRKLHFQ